MNVFIQASKIWPLYSDEHTRYVRVKGNVANITNKQVLIRRVLTHPLEPGLYNIGTYGELKRAHPPASTLLNYPDIDLLEGFFNNLKPLASMDQHTRLQMLESIRQFNGQAAIITTDRIKTKYDYESPVTFMYPFNLDPEMVISSRYLEIILLVFHDYPILHFGRVNGQGSPLIIGIDWGNCAFLAPFSTY